MKRWLMFSGVLMMIVALLAAAVLGIPGVMAPRTRDDSPPTKYLIGMSQANLIEPWRVTMNRELEHAAAEHFDLRVIFTDAAGDTERQISDVAMLMGYDIDLLIISPNDSEALRPVLSEIYREIPVIVLDRNVSGDDYTLFIGPNNDMIGYLSGLRVGRMLGEEGGSVVEILGTEDSPPVAARSEGFARAIADFPNVTIQKQLVADWLQDRAEDRFKEYLIVSDRPPDVVFAQNDAMAYGAWIAAQKYRVYGTRFVGVDGLEGDGGGVDLVRRGILEATFYCPTGSQQAIDYALKILSGDVPGVRQLILDPVEITN
ncbi:MAG: substrate-binding domain-containing protein [Clostridiales bacterium]|jgi:ABC-type sugar transport system substrate-binding protein|nr:substrate-binding domain-containing protein [Clostridiales bacterium]